MYDGYYSSGGYGTEFFIDGTTLENLSGRLNTQNGSFSGTVQYSSSSDVPGNGSCLFLALVDHRLTPLYYNGSLSRSHMISYQLPVRCNVSFNLTGLQEGFHDVLLLTIKNPYADPLEIAGYHGHNGIDGSGMPFNVIEGNASKPDPLYGAGPLEKYVTYRNSSGKNLLGYGPWLTEEPFLDMYTDSNRPTDNAIESMNAAPGETVDYYINFKNGDGPTNGQYDHFALLQLLDYEQVPIRQDTPDYVYYGALDPGRYFAIHACIIAPETPGTHILTLVLTANQYEDYSPENPRTRFIQIIPVILNVQG